MSSEETRKIVFFSTSTGSVEPPHENAADGSKIMHRRYCAMVAHTCTCTLYYYEQNGNKENGGHK